jgi:DNA end-binding protein Ku
VRALTKGFMDQVDASPHRAPSCSSLARGIVLWTLHYGDEVRDPTLYFANVKTKKIESELLSRVESPTRRRTKRCDREMVADPVQDRLLAVIAEKKKGRRPLPKSKETPERPSNAIGIVDALRKSLDAEGKRPRDR